MVEAEEDYGPMPYLGFAWAMLEVVFFYFVIIY